ncbi:hypothetical protein NE237_006071 [Protea cynaroides]|uniref:Uncharacterized protein n=1 Tax=Protea cynaroides TaxID=273540 RepID=A0A9Q0QV32_9MAGN|nr:hypothetical protein NE237_006071 [Protea cynaroides]
MISSLMLSVHLFIFADDCVILEFVHQTSSSKVLWRASDENGRNRRNRESSILKSIESGAETLFDIVAKTYADVDPSVWIYASSNVRLHVDYLAVQDRLPMEFSIQRFRRTFGLHFLSRWTWVYLRSNIMLKDQTQRRIRLLTATAVVGFAVFYAVKHKV